MGTTGTVTEPRTVLRLCGGVELEIAGHSVAGALPSGQATVLLACLAVSERPLSRDELAEALWPVRAPADPQAVLSTLLSRLRRVLGSEAVAGRGEVELRLPQPLWFDVQAARDAVGEAREALAASAWSRLLERSRLALDILGRTFLVGHEAPWIDGCRRDLEDLQLAALELEARGGLGLGAGGLERAAHAARTSIAIAPYREAGYRVLMEALESEGNVAEAVRVYERLRVLLRDELGTAPAPELRVLHERLLTGASPGVSRPSTVPSTARRRAPISVPPRAAFVGRANELERLEALRLSESRRVIAVAGEPGIGKTRLVSEFVGRAEADGALVLFGRCDEETLVAYQPFIEALRGYVSGCPVEQLRRQVADAGPELSRILPALRRRLPDLPEPPRSESETERFRLFELVAGFLARIEASAPLVLVLDDLHWADRPTLSLLRHLSRSREGDARAPLIVATYRSTEMGAAPAEALADLDRERLVGRISLAGLGAAEVAGLMADWAGAEPPPELARAVHEASAGNPFFVEELLRQLAEAGAVAPGEGRWTADVAGIEAVGVPEGSSTSSVAGSRGSPPRPGAC
ncbi:MAG: AAA family ATPase [Thermoleophilaceae bacterium]